METERAESCLNLRRAPHGRQPNLDDVRKIDRRAGKVNVQRVSERAPFEPVQRQDEHPKPVGVPHRRHVDLRRLGDRRIRTVRERERPQRRVEGHGVRPAGDGLRVRSDVDEHLVPVRSAVRVSGTV